MASGGTTTDATSAGSVISLPQGGGAVSGLGEKFSPDLFTGTGNLSVPLALPAGRGAATPKLALEYSSGNGNGLFGLGWQLALPGVSRRTSHGLPAYDDTEDVFLLSGAEDLVPVSGTYPGRVRYRPRTETNFARIEHIKDGSGDYWEVRGREGLRTRYGTPRPDDAPANWRDPAVVADPADPGRVFSWRVTETVDPLGNLVRYQYQSDAGSANGHTWSQPVPLRVSYGDYGDQPDPQFLITVDFLNTARPDPFSDYRAGFETRTSLRCNTIRVGTHTADGATAVQREYRLDFDQAPFTGVSLLRRISQVGIDTTEELLPPLVFGYSGFDPTGRRFAAVTGAHLPTGWPGDPALSTVDSRGVGLPDIVRLGPGARVWANLGDGRFGEAGPIADSPPFALDQPGVSFLDADGDGRADLLVSTGAGAGYFPTAFGTGWRRRNFVPYRHAPSVGLDDPSVRMIDLDGDGLTDLLRSGTRLEAWFNDRDPDRAWRRTDLAAAGPPVDLSDPSVRLADMTGDGLQDIVLLRNGNIRYWPNLGRNRWGAPIAMRQAPRLPDRYNPARLLLADVDGDGVADLLYVDNGRILLWGNQSGNSWTAEPVVVTGTPAVSDRDGLEICDLYGNGMAGLLYGRAGGSAGRPYVRFLDFTGGVKPHLLATVDNSRGARTTVTYSPSTGQYLRDAADPATRWRTTLPFPVQVVTRIEVADQISGGTLTTEYRYHHGYWDGVEREFRGFAMVEQLDTEAFRAGGSTEHYSPPVLTKTWFHPGPVATAEAGDWTELDLVHEYWPGDAPMLTRPADQVAWLAGLSRTDRRSALRALRGQMLRIEVYGQDGTSLAPFPYSVGESISGVRQEAAGQGSPEKVFFPFALAGRVTQWERGPEPMTQFTFPVGYDAYGCPTGELAIAVPRGRDPLVAGIGEPYLATLSRIEYARRDDAGHYLADRVSRTLAYEVVNDGGPSVFDLRAAVSAQSATLRQVGQQRTYYDGPEFVGLPLGTLGDHGLPVRTEKLAFTDDFLDSPPPYLSTGDPQWPQEYPAGFRTAVPALAGYTHDADGFFVQAQRCRYDVHVAGAVPRGRKVAALDPFGALGTIRYDQHDLLPVEVTDAAGLTTTAQYDYRLLRPRSVTDANGSTSSVTFSPAGFVTQTFQQGHDGEGDQAAASVATVYNLMAFAGSGKPAWVRTTRRVHHDTDTGVPAAERDQTIVSVAYSDGFGRVVQTRTQAEDTLFGDPAFGGGVLPIGDLAPAGDSTGRSRAPGDPDNVVVSGWQVYDNKGRVVQKYEPFFSTGYDYAPPRDALLGQKDVMFYDPRGQLVRTVHPDASELRAILGVPRDLADPDDVVPTPWESYTYDSNDNAGRTHGASTAGYQSHWNTPASAEVDALGRVVRSVARNGTGPADLVTTTSSYDIQGNLLAVTDTYGRAVAAYHHDLLGRCWRTESMDAGRRDAVPDAGGQIVETRDSKGALTLGAFDRLRRPARIWARDDAAGPVTLRGVIEYGDGGDPAQPAADRASARAAYLLGRPVRHHDEAGLITVGAADFKGNVLSTTRQVIADAPILAGYERAADDGWNVNPFVVDWDQDPATLLNPAGYRTDNAYDALSRLVSQTLPAAASGQRSEIRPVYNRSGALESVTLDGAAYVQRIAYDAGRRRALVAFGNGVMTRYGYDPVTFRLARMRTEAYTVSGLTYHPAGTPIADHGYDYDLSGNVLAVRDRAPGSGIPHNPAAGGVADPVLRGLIAGGDALDRRFTYDPLYRLASATGREYAAPAASEPWTASPSGTDVTATQAYAETYVYDNAGFLTGLQRTTAGGRSYDPAGAGGNRLRRLRYGTTAFLYEHDPSGNVVAEGDARSFAWNHDDRLAAFATRTPGAEPSIHAQYLYDATGQRVTKLVRRQGGTVEVTQYVGAVFEHHRWGLGSSRPGENNHLHVLDDRQRVALVRIGPAHPDDTGPAVAYHVGDHLGSSVAVLDGTGTLTNREEYTPYGETSFGSYTRKRYRFTGMERDEESGFAYHSARYYAPWLARFISADPAGIAGGLNLYAYSAANPLRLLDPGGQAPQMPTTAENVTNHANAVADLGLQTTLAEQDLETEARALARAIEGGQPFDVRAVVAIDERIRLLLQRFNALNVDSRALTGDVRGDPVLARTVSDARGRLNGIGGRLVNEAARAAALEWGGGIEPGPFEPESRGGPKGSGGPTGGGQAPPEQPPAAEIPQARVIRSPRWRSVGAGLGAAGRALPWALAIGSIIKDPSLKNVVQQGTGIAFGAGVEAVTRLALGRAAFAGAGQMLALVVTMRSDNAKFAAEQEQAEALEAAETDLRNRVLDYADSHPHVPNSQIRQMFLDQTLQQGLNQLISAHIEQLTQAR